MKIYTPAPVHSQDIFPLFLFKFAPERKAGGLFKDNLPENYFQTVEYTDAPQGADAIILPNNFTQISPEVRLYIEGHTAQAHAQNIPIYAFSSSDYAHRLPFPKDVQVFSYSLYKSIKKPGDISTPALTEDLGKAGIALRSKSDMPTVSFCGKAGFSSTREWLGSWIRRIEYELLSVINSKARARIRGVFWRMWMLEACKTPLLKTRFVVRKTFSGALRTIEVPPEQARKEFIDSMIESDFVLAPKGDGNHSNRFLEALSMGRIPVLLDTDVVLPFEDSIDYSKIVVRVPMAEVSQTSRYIRDFYDLLSEEEWQIRQRLARETFEKYLRQDSFFKNYFLRKNT